MAAGRPRIEHEPTAAELAQQQTRLSQLQATAKRQTADLGDTRAALQASAVLAGQALEEYSVAVRTLRAHQLIEQRTQDTLEQAQQSVDVGRQQVGSWARQAYQGGTSLAADPTLNAVLQGGASDDVTGDLAVLTRIGRHRQRALAGFERDRQLADAAADAAADASQSAAEAAIAATSAHRAADQAVAVQRRLLDVTESSLAGTKRETRAAIARQAKLKAALATPPQVRNGNGSGGRHVTGPVGSCTGNTVDQYANGEIPLRALCPLWSESGQYLRADAAYAFDRLNHAYAGAHGRPICITDSYRTYDVQVSLYGRKPTLAAIPGTSNHGWGTAVDLCGGIQSFGTAEHRWMLLNAPLYGWFHPGWAEPTGSRPEPWHWEYGG